MSIEMQKHINLLGLRVKDRVSGFTGIVSSISFDLYGCIQAIVNPGLDKEGKPAENYWFDVNRLTTLDEPRCMERPAYEWATAGARADKGPEIKPSNFKV